VVEQSIVVMKLGSSVLRSVDAFSVVAHEIYRHVRRGERVVAVVSALEGQTNRLLAEARAVAEDPDPHHVATLLGLGEHQSALLLTLALDRAGLAAIRLGPAELSLTAAGDPLDADPVALDAAALLSALQEHSVAVVPGFIALDEQGRDVLLGRGGSDLTALFIANALGGVPCRLIKDVDGIYEHDPAAGGAAPRRFGDIAWSDALRVSGRLVQPKAIEFAQAHQLGFEVAALGAARGTRVGAGPTQLAPCAHQAARLRVALFGAGTVGYGVYRHLAADPERFEIVGIAVGDLGKARPDDLPRALLTDDPWALLHRPADLVIDVLGDDRLAFGVISHALRSGKDVVTANKPVIAHHGPLLEALAREHGRQLAYSASVGGSLPCVELVRLAAHRGRITGLEGVLNGTCNFILDRLAAGDAFGTALADAQRRGFAEADPTQDLSGQDAASKLRILVREAFGRELGPEDLSCLGIEGLSAKDMQAQGGLGLTTRVVAACRHQDGVIEAQVAPRVLAANEPLARVRGEWNQLCVELEDGARILARGKGAGRWPTAQAVFADVMDAWRATRRTASGMSAAA
jgi:homoserine dehydrogenase